MRAFFITLTNIVGALLLAWALLVSFLFAVVWWAGQ